jgi:hypothetical protein
VARGKCAHRRLEALVPPDEAQGYVDELVAGLRQEAARLGRAADGGFLRSGEFQRLLCCTPSYYEQATHRLLELGYRGVVIREERWAAKRCGIMGGLPLLLRA